VFTTATFIGYILGGPTGAVVATAGIFAPAFVFVAIAGPFVRKLRASKIMGGLLDSMNVGSLALMVYVACELARSAIADWTSLGIAIASALILFTLRINSTWLVAAGAGFGVVATFLGTR
jgi:chromate transporter